MDGMILIVIAITPIAIITTYLIMITVSMITTYIILFGGIMIGVIGTIK